METKWLEDFVSLAETRSFSRSAQLRHVTQPAFSRRIQALEAWAGTDLVDRSSYPTRLTPAGETLYAQSLEVLQALQSTRAMLRGHAAAGQVVIEFAVPHSLAFTFFPAWASSLRDKFGPSKSRLIALNVHDAVMRLVEGSGDIFIGYHPPSQPFQLDRVYETDFAGGRGGGAREGHGVAFLPFSAVKKELRSKRLVSAAGEVK